MPAPPRRPAKADPFEQEIEQALQPHYFVNYRASWSFVEGLDRVEERIAKLVGRAPARAASHSRRKFWPKIFEIYLQK